jgi:uncharacterized protein YyaL (SSP411 family)
LSPVRRLSSLPLAVLLLLAGPAVPAADPPPPRASAPAAAEQSGPSSAPRPPAAASKPAPRPASAGEPEAGTSAAGPWLEWGPEAFRKAALRDKPILLNLVVSWNKGCQSMESVWQDPRIARLLSQSFIPIRVDADRRPDIRERYPGPGWPAITILLPNGIPFYAAREGSPEPVRVAFTALPADKLAPILEEAARFLSDKTKRELLKKTVEEGLKAEAPAKFERAALDPGAPPRIFDSLRANFDAVNGGWTRAPKYPLPAPIEGCLFAYSQDHDARFLEVGEKALQAIVGGALFDGVDGGIHRIAMREDWKEPEYEKLLDRNVALLDELLAAYTLTSKKEYADRAADIVRYLNTTLRSEDGGFAASQDADPASDDGGAYYRASAEERKKLTPPPVSPLQLVGWSAKAAAAELRGARLLERPEWTAPALATLAWAESRGYRRGRGAFHAIDGKAAILPAFLEDQVLFTEAMIDSYQLTGDKHWLEVARDTAGFALANLYDARIGVFGDIIPDPGSPARPMRQALNPFDWNCRMAGALAKLFYLTPQETPFRDAALGVLENFGGRIERGPGAALYAISFVEFREGPFWVWLIGNKEIPGTSALLSASVSLPVLWKIVVTLNPADARDSVTIAQLAFIRRSPPVVYLTKGTHTSKPAHFLSEVGESFGELNKLLTEESAAAAEGAPAKEGAPAAPGAPAGASAPTQEHPR